MPTGGLQDGHSEVGKGAEDADGGAELWVYLFMSEGLLVRKTGSITDEVFPAYFFFQ